MTQENEPLKPPKETSSGSSGPDPGIYEKKSEGLDVDEDGTVHGDTPILKTAEEMAATEPVHGWTDPWKRRCTTRG